MAVQYGSGSFSGEECEYFHFMFLASTMCLTMFPKVTDDVKLGSATINGQSIGVASTSTGFTGMRFLISQINETYI